jgi:hypothetical protein
VKTLKSIFILFPPTIVTVFPLAAAPGTGRLVHGGSAASACVSGRPIFLGNPPFHDVRHPKTTKTRTKLV